MSHRQTSRRLSRLVGVLGLWGMLAACGGGSSGDPSPTPPPAQPPDPPPPPPRALANPIQATIGFGDLRVQVSPFVRAPRSNDSGKPGITNNAYARIQYLQQLPDDSGRMFFSDTRGLLYLTDADGSEPTVYLDLRIQEVGFFDANYPNESGFMGFAVHPQFSVQGAPGYGKFYTSFSSDPGHAVADYIEEPGSIQESSVVEWTATDAAATTFEGASRELLRVGQFAANHNIGALGFNPTAEAGSADFGMLYLSFGDGGSANDPRNHGQNTATPLGTIMRIDPLGGGDDESYGIPSDNPDFENANSVPGLWAYGLRHPQHFSWDSTDGRLFMIDIGQNSIEEVNLGVAGGNYGWRLREGTFATAYGVNTNDRAGSVYEVANDSGGFEYPIAQYDHDDGFAVSSGFVYRGEAIPDLQGMYVFAELVRGRLFYIDANEVASGTQENIQELRILVDGAETSFVDLAGHTNTHGHAGFGHRVDLRLSVDAKGELYALSKGDGWIRKLVAP